MIKKIDKYLESHDSLALILFALALYSIITFVILL